MASKQVILITGGNTGLGYETVKALCQSSTAYEILIGSRSVQNGEDAVEKLKKEVSETVSAISVVQVDISSDDSIEKAAEHVKAKYGKLDILINNVWPTQYIDIYSY